MNEIGFEGIGEKDLEKSFSFFSFAGKKVSPHEWQNPLFSNPT
jgi:hypothetical protein